MTRFTKGIQAALVLACAAALPHAFAASNVVPGEADSVARASIDLRIEVPRVMQMKLVAHPVAIDVTSDDIARGTIKVTGAMLDLLVNDRLGYMLRADLAAGAFTAVKISGLASTLVATQTGSAIRMASMVGQPKPAPMPVEYELQLAPDAQPGHYSWPVTLSLQQL